MAAQDAVVLENHLKLFAETKVGEAIALEFTTGHVYIKPVKKHGSITLGSFWVRVIQAYFPSPEFTYKKSYNSSQASEILMTVADGYTIKIYLRTGLVVVEGDVVYEWFKVIFRKVIQHYDKSTHSTSSDYRREQYILDSRKEIQQKEKRRLFPDRVRPEMVDEKLALVSSDVSMPELDSRFASDKYDDTYNESGHSTMQLVACGPFDQNVNSSMCLRDGNTYVYPMWKQLLNKWLNIDGCKVHVCSKHMDVTRYKELSSMAYKNRLNTGIEAIYTNVSNTKATRMPAVKELVMKGHTADEQLFIEYRILNKTRLATTKQISCNFIAGVYPNESVELMLTSATFDEDALDKSQNLHSVTLFKISSHDFRSNFLDRLAML